MKVISLHSYKGGTGKTSLSANIAVTLAKQGFSVALLDIDFRGPNLKMSFDKYLDGKDSKKSINDYIIEDFVETKDFLIDMKPLIQNLDLKIGFASQSFEKMKKIVRVDKNERQNNLKKMLILKDILKDEGYDYVILDTSPGIHLESIDGLVISDLILLILKPEDIESEGVKSMINELYDLLESKNYAVINRVVELTDNEVCVDNSQITEEKKRELTTSIKEKLNLELLGAIKCHCMVANKANQGIFALEYPEHKYNNELEILTKELFSILGKE